MSYWEMPAEGFETPERTEYRAGLGVAAARRARP
jgi:hypothetical protein